jgi:oxygen-dependent protoporphyrinogen oxidase
VIGAGIAGLSAAWELRKGGFDVSIFEKEDFTGGRMRRGWMGPLYQFTHAVGILEANREMFDLAGELGVRDQLEGEVFTDTIDNGHGTYPFRLDFHIDELVKIPGFSPDTRRRLPVLQEDLDEIREQVDPCLLATGAGYDGESLGEYYQRRLGRQAADQLIRFWIEPVCSAAGWPVFETSKMALLPWLSQQQAGFVYPRGGIDVLTHKLGALLPVQHKTVVRYIAPPDGEGRRTVHYLTPEFERRSVTPDVVVCTVEGKYLDKMIQGLTPLQEAFARDIYFTKEAIVCYILEPRYAPPAFTGGSYIPTHPDPVKARTTYWFVTPGGPAFDNHPPHARYALSRQDTPRWQISNKTIEEYCFPMLKALYPPIEEHMVRDIVNYTCDDLIYMPVGYITRMADVLREQGRERRCLYLAGEYVSGGHTGAACASGRSIARTIIRHWG